MARNLHSTEKLVRQIVNTELSGRNKRDLYIIITYISDVVKQQKFWKERLVRRTSGSSLLLLRLGV